MPSGENQCEELAKIGFLIANSPIAGSGQQLLEAGKGTKLACERTFDERCVNTCFGEGRML